MGDLPGIISAALELLRIAFDCVRWFSGRRERRSGGNAGHTVTYLPPTAERRSGLDRRLRLAA